MRLRVELLFKIIIKKIVIIADQPILVMTENSIFIKSQRLHGSGLTLSDFKEGDRVVYLAAHNRFSPRIYECEPGLVTSVDASRVNVRFWDESEEDYKAHPEPCVPNDLWHRL